MKPIFARAQKAPKRVIYVDGEDERVMRAAQVAIEDRIAVPVLIGRPQVVEERLKNFGLSIKPGRDFELINPQDDPRYQSHVQSYVDVAGRKGITPDAASNLVRTNPTIIGALALKTGEVDAMLCGLEGRFATRLKFLRDIIGLAPGVHEPSAMTLMITTKGSFFLADTHVRQNPSAEEIAEMTMMCANHVRRFGLPPKIALISHSDFGASDSASARKMREALDIISERAPDIEVDGEMQADTALSQFLRDKKLPNSRLKGEANVLVMPNLDAANIAYQMTRMLADALPVGPILLGLARPAHILSTSVTARGVVNMTAIAVAEAQDRAERGPFMWA
jgi:malate dehydrogenase (oxaloacetate-decarboxylating)(NADP+)